jgi:long-chain fatty acid transport protein
MQTAFAVVTAFGRYGVALTLVLAFDAHVSATGFFINQQSVRGLGRVNAGNPVAADELATIFFNPAGLPLVFSDNSRDKRVRAAVATHLIVPRGTQRNAGSRVASPSTLGAYVPVTGADAHNPTDPTPVPNFYLAMPLNERAAVGVGINSPFGLTTVSDSTWHGRYDATDASLRTINVSAVGGYRFASGVSVGGGLDAQYARSLLTAAIPNPLASGGPSAATDAWTQTKGHDSMTLGFNVGVLYEVKAMRVGAHYRSGMTHQIDGTSETHELQGPLALFNGTVDARAELRLPAVLGTGVRVRFANDVVVLGGFDWFDWSTFDEVRIRFADGRPDAVRPSHYRDAYALAGGIEAPLKPGWVARGGLRFDTTPTIDQFRDTTVPDANRTWVGAGTTMQVRDGLSIDLAFNHVFFEDTTIAVTRQFFDNTPLATTVNINSNVSSVVNTIAVDLRWRF